MLDKINYFQLKKNAGVRVHPRLLYVWSIMIGQCIEDYGFILRNPYKL